MDYTTILNSLPRDVAELLQRKLDATTIHGAVDPSLAQTAIELVVEQTRREMVVSAELETTVHALLDQVPAAALQVLFFS